MFKPSQAASLAALALSLTCQHARAEWQKVMHPYKTVGDLEIKADVHRDNRDERQRPVVVWIHGGALINGHRESVPRWLVDACREKSYTIVSIDYRLAPETQLPEIIADVEDAFRWIGDKGPALFHADPVRIAVVGGSAGGYLTLVTGYRAKPRPVALVPLWGYGDLIGPWYSQPSPHPRHHTTKLSREEAFKQVAGPPVSDSRQRKGDGGGFYQFCRQQGLWPKAVSGWDPHSDAENFTPFMPVRNVTPNYPPTLLIHGETDTDVPHEQSVVMSVELKKHRVEQRLLSIPNAEHGLAGVDASISAEAYRAAADFLQKHLEQK
jgi:acetyl esterase/lipase